MAKEKNNISAILYQQKSFPRSMWDVGYKCKESRLEL